MPQIVKAKALDLRSHAGQCKRTTEITCPFSCPTVGWENVIRAEMPYASLRLEHIHRDVIKRQRIDRSILCSSRVGSSKQIHLWPLQV